MTSDPWMTRQAHDRVERLFLQRWSPRSFDGSPVPEEDLAVMFEAARWAPSEFNHQPWRFLYAHHGDANWARFLSLLIPFNAGWAKDAGVLIFILSEIMRGAGDKARPSHSHSFDAGAAWALLALQATAMGYHAHGMTGVDFDRARIELGVPEGFRMEAAAVVGRRDLPDRLPEGLRERELPSARKPVSEIAFAGAFPHAWLAGDPQSS